MNEFRKKQFEQNHDENELITFKYEANGHIGELKAQSDKLLEVNAENYQKLVQAQTQLEAVTKEREALERLSFHDCSACEENKNIIEETLLKCEVLE